MPILVSGTAWADLPGVSLTADSEAMGLGVTALRTPVLGEVWRTGPGTADARAALSTDTQAFAGKGPSTTRTGSSGTSPDGVAATSYTNTAGSSYVLAAFTVQAGFRYEVALWVRRVSGNSTAGSVLIAEFRNAAGQVVREALPMTALAQGNGWQLLVLRFRPGRAGNCSIYMVADTGSMQYQLGGASYARLAGQRQLSVDLGQLRGVLAVVLQAPRDGMLPEAGATIQAALSASTSGGNDMGEISGPLSMRRGYWVWVLPARASARYLQINLESSQPYLQFGRLWVADGLMTDGNVGESGYDAGATDEVGRPTRRRLAITAPSLSEAEADQLEDIGLAAGTQRQVLVIPRTDRASMTAVIGRFTAIPSPRPKQAWSQGGRRYTASLTIEEESR